MRNFAILSTLTGAAMLAAAPAYAAGGPFFSLRNTDFVVTLGFLLFIGILVYFKVPALITGMLDKRAETISAELAEARKLREDAQAILASYERKQRDMREQADRIVAQARDDAAAAAVVAKEDLQKSIARRLAAAEEQIAAAEASAIRDVRDRAIGIAVAAAREVIAKQMTAADGNKLIDEAIATVDAKLH